MPEHALDLRPDHLAIVRAILKKQAPGYEVWAFGSRGTGNAKRYSDLDLAIITEAPLSFGVGACLQEAFSESELPFRVDIVDWSTASPAFRAIIAQNHVLLKAAFSST
ncbi:MAG: hypothetical protein HW416_2847 [Chloroflexi bacterium]|nr:hypothetical protein [Chloroflexota bacterium]